MYLYYSPLEMTDDPGDEVDYPATTPTDNAPNTGVDPSVWDPWVGYFQLSRFKFVDGATPTLDLASEQKILKVTVNRGACCHVAGDIVFDSHNNLWLVTGDDTPAGGGNSGGFSPHNDMITATGLFNAPHVDARRSAMNTNDLRGKILRITVQEDGSYTIPDGNLFTGDEEGGGKTRPEIYAMGFRNPFRITLDDERRRVHHRLLARLADPHQLPRPGRHRPDDEGRRARELRLAAVLSARPAVLPLELQHEHAARQRRASRVRVRQPGTRDRTNDVHAGTPA